MRIGEVEAPPAGKGEHRPGDLPAGGFDARLALCQVVGGQHHQGAAGLRRAVEESAAEPSIAELTVVGAIVLKSPREGLAVKALAAAIEVTANSR